MPDDTIGLAFGFFRLQLSVVLSLSPIPHFEGLAPKTAEKKGKVKEETCHK
jgi:hypothetical protein